MTMTPEQLQAGIDAIVAAGRSTPRAGREPVNEPMMHHWLDAIGDTNPIYLDADAAVHGKADSDVCCAPAAELVTLG